MSIILYTANDGTAQFALQEFDEQLWLTQADLAELYQITPQGITQHIRAVYREGELTEEATCKKSLQVQTEGGRTIRRQRKYYSLPMIIAVGYRVRSARGTQFRQWATERLDEYLTKGFAIDDERLKGTGGGDYWKELLNRIRDIRSSEKALYRQVLDLYATSQDYNPKSSESQTFFAAVQNKLHYAASRQTAAELIYSRADSSKDFMGLTTFQGAIPTLNEAKIAKNYLTEDELFRLNRLVSAFFDLAEIKAQEQSPMYMRDWIAELDKFSGLYGQGTLQGAGSISRKQAEQKAEREYRAYEARILSPVEQAYLESVKALEKTAVQQLKQKKDGKK
ncbi:virulence RhuM family protein [Eikenella corrodens]|uniref:Cell filamentation protein Fic n=1 Tax=Eikenella corrodens TaxID=539 RepID=A0A3S9SKN2_EIKCO|nr:RhuM family protein [Eikenella corrodens]AZR60077.1 cell filamentation protein Fic [Eikenella corrodens]